jgi:hypothetical protein
MTCCERFEIDTSALLDGELTPTATLATIDHLIECPSCAELYRGGRRLDSALEEARDPARARELPAGLWERIESAGTPVPNHASVTVMRPRRRLPRWLLQAAAVLVVVGAGWWAGRSWPEPRPADDGVLQVVVEGDRGSMDDQRFIQLATELLRADRRYHVKMEEIMAAVNHRTVVSEGGGEGPAPLEDPALRRASVEPRDGRSDPPQVWY